MHVRGSLLRKTLRWVVMVGCSAFPGISTVHAQVENDIDESEESTAMQAAEEGEEESVRIYLNRRERREESRSYEISENLEIAALLDVEYGFERLSLVDDPNTHPETDGFDESLEIELLGTPFPWLETEVVFELTHEPGKWKSGFDEAVVTLIHEEWELEAGRLYMPLGEYNSFFASGPALEFGETQGRGGAASYGPSDEWDFKLAGFKSDLDRDEALTGQWDWSAAVEWSPHDEFTFGLGYLSDLSESVESVLEDETAYALRVEAWSAFALMSLGSFEVSAEYVSALDGFEELDGEFARPEAWNIEVAYYTRFPVVIAGRWEGARELEEAPRNRVGVAAIWGPSDHITITVDVLFAKYAAGFLEDALEREVRRGQELVVALSYEF